MLTRRRFLTADGKHQEGVDPQRLAPRRIFSATLVAVRSSRNRMLASWLFGNSVSDFNLPFLNNCRRPAITFPVDIPTRYVSGENSECHSAWSGLLRE